MRTISANSQAVLANRYGTEPVCIVEVSWAMGGGYLAYADRDVSEGTYSAAGKIAQMDKLDDIVDITDSGTSQSVSIVLDDTDGTIKATMDTTDIHKRDVKIWQWFTGTDISDKFLLFAGKINSPITWSEKDRTVAFAAVSTLEDFEIGFSPEDGNQGYFSSIPDDLMGVGWPMCFGTPINAKTVQLDRVHSGLLGEAIAFPAATNTSQISNLESQLISLQSRQGLIAAQMSNASIIGDWAAWAKGQEEMNQNSQEINNLFVNFMGPVQVFADGQLEAYKSSFRVIGGQYFPQGVPINLNINNARVYGTFNGDEFSIINYTMPNMNYTGQFSAPMPTLETINLVPEGISAPWDAYPSGFVVAVTLCGMQAGQSGSPSQPFFAQAGSQVTIWDNEPIRYVVSIIPGTLINATAQATLSGGYQQYLYDLPPNFYTTSWENFGTINAFILTVNNALSKPIPYSEYLIRAGKRPMAYEDTRLQASGYGDDVYATFESSVGPNVSDILKWFITTYSQHTYDADSFTAAAAYLYNYPANFSISDRKPVMQVLQEIAYQARCALYLRDGVFFLRYLPLAPTPVDTITESDILADPGLTLTYTPDSDSLVTKATGTWQSMGAQQTPNQVILRGFISKYGVMENQTDYYIYNNVDEVIKAMTFWMIRTTNTWKQISFNAPLTKLALETFDAVTLHFEKPYVANGDVLGIVKSADYDSSSNSVALTLWVPVRAGEMEVYPFAHPSNIDPQLLYPLPVDIEQGYIDTNDQGSGGDMGGGGGGGGGGGTGGGNLNELPFGWGNPLATRPGNIQPSFTNNNPYRNAVLSRWASSVGQASPSDTGDVSPGAPKIPSTVAASPSGPPPESFLTDYQLPPMKLDDSGVILDLDRTVVVDRTSTYGAVLRSFFRSVTDDFNLTMRTNALMSDGKNATSLDTFFTLSQGGNEEGDDTTALAMRTNAIVSDGSNGKPFDFQFDPEGGKWGAGTAFLKDEQ